MKYSDKNKPIQCMMRQSTCYNGTTIGKPVGVLWHSTGADNPWISRYVQPDDNAPDRAELIKKIGTNRYGTDWNHNTIYAGLNFWVGKLADGAVGTVQTLPDNYRPWGCGSGKYGSCNGKTDGPTWLQFEICEDTLNNKDYFMKCYYEACELTAYICNKYNIDPNGTVNYNGVIVPTILCHYDSCLLGLGSNHGDIYHWSKKYNINMKNVREDVQKILNGEDLEVTQEQFNSMMNTWLAERAKEQPGEWSKTYRNWAEKNGIFSGDEGGMRYKSFITREEIAAVLYRENQLK